MIEMMKQLQDHDRQNKDGSDVSPHTYRSNKTGSMYYGQRKQTNN